MLHSLLLGFRHHCWVHTPSQRILKFQMLAGSNGDAGLKAGLGSDMVKQKANVKANGDTSAACSPFARQQEMVHQGEKIARTCAHQSQPAVDPAGSGTEVLLQGFNWECNSLRNTQRKPCWLAMLAEKADQIADAGCTAVWLPPPCQSIAAEGYMPQDYDSLSTSYGDAEDLKRCIAALHGHGVKAVCDVVINHRCAQQQGPDKKWNQYTGTYSWGASSIVSNQAEQFGGTGRWKPESLFEAAPNLDHSSEQVRHDLKRWLSSLRHTVGFDGWRFDFAKGYGGSYVKEYVDATSPSFVVGEVWDPCCYDESGNLSYNQDPHRQQIVDWCDLAGGAAAGFDFTTKGVLQEALSRSEYWRLKDSEGKPPGVIGWWPARGVTFVDNHDTGSTQAHWPFPAAHLVQGYVYILTHPGTPCIFYDHLFSDGEKALGVWRSLKRLLSSATSTKEPILSRDSIASHASGSSALPPAERLGSGDSLTSAPSLASAPSGGGNPLQRVSRSMQRKVKAANSPAAVRAAILELTAVRKLAGLHCRSKIVITRADDFLYAAVIDGVVAVKIGVGSWCPQAALDHDQGCSPPLGFSVMAHAMIVRHCITASPSGRACPLFVATVERHSQVAPMQAFPQQHQMDASPQIARRQLLAIGLAAAATITLLVPVGHAAAEGSSSGGTSRIRFTPNVKEAEQRREERKADMKAKLKAKVEKAQGAR